MRVLFLAAALVCALAVACGDDSGTESAPTAADSATATTSVTQTATPFPTPGKSATSAPETVTLLFTNGAGEDVELVVEIADEPDERGRGLMNRESMPENAGMIFVFDSDQEAAFYMKDTLMPLSIAFVLADGTIIDIQDMEPQSLELHRPDEAYRYAIEVNQGWYERNGIAVGDAVAIPDTIAG